jgi:uncharacterized protein YdhG (YjbR/CyaY superfamily)
MKAVAPETIEEYLAGVSEEQRAALEKLRKIIRAAAPKAEECISYQIPTFRQKGLLVHFAAWRDHCSFYPGAKAIETHKGELENYQLSKGTIRFKVDKPIPATLIRKIVRERIVENDLKAAKKR